MRSTAMNRYSLPALVRRSLFFVALLTLVGTLSAQQGPDFSDWLAQAKGMNKAIGIQKNEGRPMLVYFYADWCNYCRQFEKELLSDSGVHDYLKDLIVVRINPEAGQAERRFGDMYGVNGYPSLFVHSSESKTLSRIDRMKLDDGKPRMMSPEEFIGTVTEAAAR